MTLLILFILLILTLVTIQLHMRVKQLEKGQLSQRIFNRSQININQQQAEKIKKLTSGAIIKQEEETKVGDLDD